jgi:hypothetical protein
VEDIKVKVVDCGVDPVVDGSDAVETKLPVWSTSEQFSDDNSGTSLASEETVRWQHVRGSDRDK